MHVYGRYNRNECRGFNSLRPRSALHAISGRNKLSPYIFYYRVYLSMCIIKALQIDRLPGLTKPPDMRNIIQNK